MLRRVRDLVGAGFAQCVIGNHELNLLRDVDKHGNGWWVSPDQLSEHPAAPITPDDKREMLRFLMGLPLVLERADLRVVHACWNGSAIAALRERQAVGATVLDLYREYSGRLRERWSSGALVEALKSEYRDFGPFLRDPDWSPVLLPTIGRMDSEYQMSNPVCIVTSGEERPTGEPFWAGGRWRMVERVRWWEEYQQATPVVVGALLAPVLQAQTVYADKYGPDLSRASRRTTGWVGDGTSIASISASAVATRSAPAENRSIIAAWRRCGCRNGGWFTTTAGSWEIGAPGASH